MHRILLAALAGVLLTSSSAFADDDGAPTRCSAVTADATSLAQHTDLTAILVASHPLCPRRPSALPTLYATTALLQGFDAYSTVTVLKHGGSETNPVMKGLAKSPAAFIGLKAGVATLSIISAERMWKRGNRVGAVMTMVASNAVMAYVAARNAHVVSQLKK